MSGSAGSDAVLVAQARAGNREAFAELAQRHGRMATRLCQHLLADPGLAEDAVQEALLQAVIDLERLRRPERFGAWLAGIALNVSRRWLRAQARSGEALSLDSLVGGRRVADPSAADDPSEIVAERELARQVHTAVGQLPVGQREAVVFFYLGGLSYAETAMALGVPSSAVKTRLHNARAHLRRSLLHLWEENMQTTASSEPTYVDVELTDIRRVLPQGAYTMPRNVLQLQESSGERRVLGVWVGPFESEAILILMSGVETPRPLTFAFAARLAQATGARVREVRINRLVSDTYFAETVLVAPGGLEYRVDARPSDAIALALVAQAPMRVAEEVMREAGRLPSTVPPADGTRVLDKTALLNEMERMLEQRETERELVNAEIRARRETGA